MKNCSDIFIYIYFSLRKITKMEKKYYKASLPQ